MPATDSLSSTVLNKVPQVTIWFWIIKVLATTVGETGADLITVNLDMGLAFTSWLMSGVFLIALVFQVRANRYSRRFTGSRWF